MPYYPFKQSGGGSGSNTVKLIENLKLGYSNNIAKSNPLDANNYITVNDNVVTLKRTGSWGLWLTIPIELEVGKKYAFAYDSITNGDGKLYLDRAPNGIPETGDVSIIRADNIALDGRFKGIVISVSTTGYYGMQIWSGNTNDIVVNNPSITEIN